MAQDRRVAGERRKAPSYPWFVRDYAEDEAVKLMTYEQEGIYRRLLDHQWFEGGLPGDLTAVACLVPKVSARRFQASIWPAMSAKFELVNGRLVNPKLERVRADQQAYKERQSAAGKLGAAERWQAYSGRDGDRIAKV